MKNNTTKAFLTTFFSLFKAYLKEFTDEGNKVIGVIRWQDDEDTQSFSWVTNLNEYSLLRMKALCDFLIQHNLVQGDKIILSLSELKTSLHENGWNEREAKAMINNLCLVRVKMIDDGEETDSFFIHF